MVAMVYKGDEELNSFPKILKSGYINDKDKKIPYLLLKTEFSGASGPGGTLTSQVGCCNLGDKIMKLEQCFDETTIAIIGI